MPESLQPLKMYGYMSKETYIYMKRDLYITKKDLWKTHWCPSLDTLWKSMDIYQKRLVYIWKETNVLRKKTCENPIDAQVCTFSENLWIYIKRDLYIYEKRPIWYEKRPVKTPLMPESRHSQTIYYVTFISKTWLIHVCNRFSGGVDSSVRVSFICVTRRIHMCDMAHSHVWHDSFNVWHDAFICGTWLIQRCDVTHSYLRHDSFIYVTDIQGV